MRLNGKENGVHDIQFVCSLASGVIRSSDALISDISAIIDQNRPIVDSILAGDIEASGHLSEQHNLTDGKKLSNHLKHIETKASLANTPDVAVKKKTTKVAQRKSK